MQVERHTSLSRGIGHNTVFLALAVVAHTPDRFGYCRPCSAAMYMVPWPCPTIALLASRLRTALAQSGVPLTTT